MLDPLNSSQLEGTTSLISRGSETGAGGGARCGLTAVIAAALVLGSPVSMAAQVDFAISCARADSIVKRLFDGYFATHTCAHDPRIHEPAVTPYFVLADFNGDRVPDLAVAAWPCLSTENRQRPEVPFRLFRHSATPGPFGEERRHVDEFLKAKPRYGDLRHARFLIILHGSADRDFEETAIQDRLVLGHVMGWGPIIMTLFYGRLKPAILGDAPRPFLPPKGSITGIMLGRFTSGEGEVIYWNGKTYSPYPWYVEDY